MEEKAVMLKRDINKREDERNRNDRGKNDGGEDMEVKREKGGSIIVRKGRMKEPVLTEENGLSSLGLLDFPFIQEYPCRETTI